MKYSFIDKWGKWKVKYTFVSPENMLKVSITDHNTGSLKNWMICTKRKRFSHRHTKSALERGLFFIHTAIHQAGDYWSVLTAGENWNMRLKEMCMRARAARRLSGCFVWRASRVACVHCVCICVWPRACNYYDVSPVFGACASHLDRQRMGCCELDRLRLLCVPRSDASAWSHAVCVRPKTGCRAQTQKNSSRLPDVLICGVWPLDLIYFSTPAVRAQINTNK